MKNKINQKQNQIAFWLNSATYSLEAIYSAAYVFLDRAYVYLDGDPKKEIIIFLKGKKKLNKKQLEDLIGEFCNELLNYVLRVEIAKRNKKIRDFIVGTALVSSLPLSGVLLEDSKESYLDDPLGIAVPWEEKYKEKKTKKKK
jgi:His-Xaa-Ser system protein HxsD